MDKTNDFLQLDCSANPQDRIKLKNYTILINITGIYFDDVYNLGMAAIPNKAGHRNVFLRVPVESLDACIGIPVSICSDRYEIVRVAGRAVHLLIQCTMVASRALYSYMFIY